MTASINFVMHENEYVKEFSVGDKPSEKYKGIRQDMVRFVQLSGPELQYAISALGAAPVNKEVVYYFGDEARRIFFNWG